MSNSSHQTGPTIDLTNDELMLAQLLLNLTDSERNALKMLIDRLLKDEHG